MILLVIIAVLVLALILVNVRIVPQAHTFVVERLGKYSATWEAGLHVKIPFVERIEKTVCLKEQVVDFAPQPVITKDNVTVNVDTVVYYSIFDSEKYVYGVNAPILAIENLSATTLRNIIGDLELDGCLTSRDTINSQITALLDEASDPWGIKVHRVEIKNIDPPADIKEAMEKQMRAERNRRSVILEAEGEKRSRVLKAEAEKESKLLEAEAQKEYEIKLAEADKEAKILRAEADKIVQIKLAEAEAEKILKTREAVAEGIKKINAAVPSEEYIKLKSLESFEKIADGKATKIIIPSEIQNIAGLFTGVKETAQND